MITYGIFHVLPQKTFENMMCFIWSSLLIFWIFYFLDALENIAGKIAMFFRKQTWLIHDWLNWGQNIFFPTNFFNIDKTLNKKSGNKTKNQSNKHKISTKNPPSFNSS
jgi:hypothetical protein